MIFLKLKEKSKTWKRTGSKQVIGNQKKLGIKCYQEEGESPPQEITEKLLVCAGKMCTLCAVSQAEDGLPSPDSLQATSKWRGEGCRGTRIRCCSLDNEAH